jgi:hypothetical protein
MLKEYIENYLSKDKSRSNKSNLIKLLILDNQKFEEIDSFIPFGTFKQKLYHFINGIKEIPYCLMCKSNVNWVEKDFCYRETCSSKCSGKLNLYRSSPKDPSHPILSTKEEYYEYFISNKIKIIESSIEKYYPELVPLISIIKFTDDFNQKVYCYLKDIKQKPLCKNCGLNEVEFDTFSKGYHDYCSIKCSSNSKEKKNKITETNRRKYGVDNIGEVTRSKALETMSERYGSHISLTDQYKEKTKNTNINRYGDGNYFKTDDFKAKSKDYFVKNFGVDSPMKVKENVDKALKTRKENGHIFKWSTDEIKFYERYRQKVTYLSEKSYRDHINEVNPNDYNRGHLTYHLDHIYPVILGFMNNIDAELISDYKNLQILPHNENRSKSDNTDMTVDDFYRLINLSKNQFTS